MFPYYVLSNLLSNRNYNLSCFVLIWGFIEKKTQHEQQNVSKGRFFYGLPWTYQGWISDMGIDGPTFVPKSGYFLPILVKVCPQKLAFS